MRIFLVLLLMSVTSCIIPTPKPPYVPSDEAIVIEAESYTRARPSSVGGRMWYEVDFQGETVMQVLPDTRITHDDPMEPGSFFNNRGGAELDFDIHLEEGDYTVWGRCYSEGTEDNGVHVGVNGDLSNNGTALQWCGTGSWVWSSAQRDSDGPCGKDGTIWIRVTTTGIHTITLYQREDGFRLDKLTLEPR